MVAHESGEVVKVLPHLMLDSLSQNQLKELIPELVTQVTGRTSPLFDSQGDKPDWWPCDLEWTNPEDLTEKYQDPCEKLREIVRSCYCYMDQDSLLTSSNLAELSSELPPSPAVGDTDMCATDPEFEQSTSNQIKDTSVTGDSQGTGEPNDRMTIQSDNNSSSVVHHSQARKNNQSEGKVLPSVSGRKDNNGTAVSANMDTEECEIMGISVNTETGSAQDISADVIAQIDLEIAKSLKAAFANIGKFGINNKTGGNKGGSSQTENDLSVNTLFGIDTYLKEQPKAVQHRRSSADETKQNDTADKPFSKISKQMSKQTSTVPSNFEKTQRKASVHVYPVTSFSRNEMERTRTTNIKEDIRDNIKDVKTAIKDEKHEDDAVWICFICAKEFADQLELMMHQDICEDEPDPVASSHPAVLATTLDNQLGASTIPVPALLRKVGSSLKSLPLGIPNKGRLSKRRQRKFEDIYIPPSRDVYFESLGLFPTPHVEAFAKSPRKSVNDDDCQIIDLTVEEAPQAIPVTPRTRYMMSQLSREDSNGRKRQLSFSQCLPKVDAIKEDEDSSDEDAVQKRKVPSKSVILGIPLTSPLGQRLKKNWKFENKVPVIEDIEHYCKTDAKSLINLDQKVKKTPMVEKLRNRPPPQCTFRFTKKYINKWFHSYKFNAADKHEFEKRLKTSLNRDSRILKKQMKRCKVVMARISKKDIKYWTTPRPKAIQKRYLPDTSMLQQYNQQYRRNQIQYAMSSAPNLERAIYSQLMQPVRHTGPMQFLQPIRSAVPIGHLLQPIRNAGPTPQLLVRTVPMGGAGMRLQVLPVQQTSQNQNLYMSSKNSLSSAAPREVVGSQKRKQVFNNVREDDNLVICLSSDDEDEIVVQPLKLARQQSCTMCQVSRETCRLHGMRRIGPACFMRQQSKNLESLILSNAEKTANSPVNVISHKPPNIGQSAQNTNTNTASAKVFGIAPRNSNITNVRMADGVATVLPTGSTSDLVHNDATETVSAVNEETGSSEIEQNENQSAADSEYMDYEVICIDSDEDNE